AGAPAPHRQNSADRGGRGGRKEQKKYGIEARGAPFCSDDFPTVTAEMGKDATPWTRAELVSCQPYFPFEALRGEHYAIAMYLPRRISTSFETHCTVFLPHLRTTAERISERRTRHSALSTGLP